MKMKMKMTDISALCLIPLIFLLTGCSHLSLWSDKTDEKKIASTPVIWSVSDPEAISIAAANSFPRVPDSVKALNHYPVVPLHWVTEMPHPPTHTAKQGETVKSSPDIAPARKVPVSQDNRQKNGAYHALISQVSDETGVDADLLHAMIKVESNYQPGAVSHKGARGLMQVMPATGRRFGYTDLSNPEHNVRAGATYMKWLIDHFDNDLILALAGYNAGEGAVKKYNRQIPPYKETQHYVTKVLSHYKRNAKIRPESRQVITPAKNKKEKNEPVGINGKELTGKLLGLLLSRPENKAVTSINAIENAG